MRVFLDTNILVDVLLKRAGLVEESEAVSEVDKILAWAQVATVGDEQARHARTLAFPDFEDAMQAVSAMACAADWLLTRDAAGFRKSPARVVAPAEFLALTPEL